MPEANPRPFLLAQKSDLIEALREAVVAARRARGTNVPERRRIAAFLCEVRARLLGAGSAPEPRSERCDFALSRADVASLLAMPLVRVKRAVGLLHVSDVVRLEGDSLEVIDWPRLCEIARFDRARLHLPAPDDETEWVAPPPPPARETTAAGEPACFV